MSDDYRKGAEDANAGEAHRALLTLADQMGAMSDRLMNTAPEAVQAIAEARAIIRDAAASHDRALGGDAEVSGEVSDGA